MTILEPATVYIVRFNKAFIETHKGVILIDLPIQPAAISDRFMSPFHFEVAGDVNVLIKASLNCPENQPCM